MDKKLNNKGFSLVEVIVVIAIIGILAVTMAPRLTQYLDKARQASDREVVNTIYTAAKLADISNPITEGKATSIGPVIYTVSSDGVKWTLNSSPSKEVTGFEPAFFNEMIGTLQTFNLKASNVTSSTKIYIGKTSNKEVFVVLDYNGNETIDASTDYIVPDHLSVDIKTLLGTSSGS